MGVTVERHGPAAVVTLDWPEQRNAVGPDECREIATAVRDAVDADTNGLVLTGNGAFCAGGNLRGATQRQGMDPEARRTIIYASYQSVIRALVDCPVPTVAAIDGAAIGLGLDLALACDSRLVGVDGWVQQGWGRVGLVGGTGGVLLLRRLHPTVLWPLLESQPRLDGPAMERLGLGEAVASGTARERAVDRVVRLSAMPRPTLLAYVALQRSELRAQLSEHLEAAATHQIALLSSPEFAARAAQTLNK